VKRLRPADLVPYRYDDAQPTGWLWVSEGVTDYYGPLAVERSGISDSTVFFATMARGMATVAAAPPVAPADASLSAWVQPKDGTAGLYYPQGALIGFALDILIRDATDNRRSLDNVLRQLYETTYKKGRGFTPKDWWRTVSRVAGRDTAGGIAFADFNRRYVEGREPQGIVKADEVEALRAELKAKFEALTDPDGVNIGTTVYKPEEVYEEVNGVAPDLIVYFGDLAWRPVGQVAEIYDEVGRHAADLGVDVLRLDDPRAQVLAVGAEPTSTVPG